MITKAEQAKDFFAQGYNCCQSVVLAFAEEAGLAPEEAAKLVSGFGGGMGRLREVCGGVSAMVFLLGLIEGYSNPDEIIGKQRLYEQVQLVAGRFKEKHGSIICRELLEASENTADTSPVPSARTAAYYDRRPCAGLVASAAAIFEDYLKEKHMAG